MAFAIAFFSSNLHLSIPFLFSKEVVLPIYDLPEKQRIRIN